MEVCAATDIDSGLYDAFVCAQPDATIYHTRAWGRALCAGFGFDDCSLVAVSDGTLVGALPLMRRRNLLGRSEVVSLPFSHLVPLLVPDVAAMPVLIGRARQVATNLIVRHSAPICESGRLVETPNRDFWLDLSGGYGATIRHFSSMARRAVRKASATGVSVSVDNSSGAVACFHRLMVATRQRQGVPIYPRRFFEGLRDELPRQSSELWLARLGGRVISGIWILRFRDRALYAYGASTTDRDALRARPNNLLFDRIVEALCEQGVSRLDLGSAHITNAGLIAFKESLGAQSVPIEYRVWPEKRALRSVARNGAPFQLVSAALRRMPQPLYRGISSKLIKSLG